jgi:uncharacterized integral membrane protein
MAKIIVVAVIVALIAAFSIQNAAPVAISFLFWRFQASLAIAIFLSTLCGVIAGAILVYLIPKRSPGAKKQSPEKGM